MAEDETFKNSDIYVVDYHSPQIGNLMSVDQEVSNIMNRLTDAKVFDKPGACPDCGMALVEQGSAAAVPARDDRRKVAILIFNGVEIIDSMGPYELFGAAGYDVYSVAETKEPVTSAMGMTMVPKKFSKFRRYTLTETRPTRAK